MYSVTSLVGGTFAIGAFTFPKDVATQVPYITPEMAAAAAAGKIAISGTPDASAVSLTSSTVTYSGGGTAATIANGARTVPAITADATALNAFATLFDEIARLRADLTMVQAYVYRPSQYMN